VFVVYAGIAVVGLTALPVQHGRTLLGTKYLEAPVLGIAESFHQHWLATSLKYVVAVAASASLIAAAQSAMLGLSRLAYSLSTNRQIPGGLGRLHPTRSTPVVVIAIAAVMAGALVLPEDLDFLVGIYAFGSLASLTLAHLSIVKLRFSEPERPRPYKMPVSLRLRGAEVPVPAVIGAMASFAAWGSIVVFHSGARYVGTAWMAFGLALYVIYRRSAGQSLTKRVVVPAEALRGEREEAEYGSILVPIFGTPLDDDIIQTAGRLAGQEHDDFDSTEGALIEALWVFEVPMALPIDARLPDAQLKRARAALARAKAVGEEYEGVEVATATVRARRAGQAIVEEARRRGVEAIVLGAEEPSRIRGGALLGGRGGPLDNFLGEVTKYVIAKAPCQVILTAPPASDEGWDEGTDEHKAAGSDGRPQA
jgi:APA family basic amino acid/polyamine antiporter